MTILTNEPTMENFQNVEEETEEEILYQVWKFVGFQLCDFTVIVFASQKP